MSRTWALTLAAIALALGASAAPAKADTQTFSPTADTYITEYEPDLVFGAADLRADVLNTCRGQGHCDRDDDGYVRSVPLVRFDLSAIPPTSTITSCELHLECWQFGHSMGQDQRDLAISAYRITSGWTEMVTWHSSPSWTEDFGPSVAVGDRGPVVMDDAALADIVQIWVDGLAPNYGLLLWPGEDIDYCGAKFYSRETAPSAPDGPHLTVTYIPPAPGTVVEAWRGGGFGSPAALSVNLADGSCWVADEASNEVVHLRVDGVELWRGGAFDSPQGVSVNPTDGSCWVSDSGNGQVVRLAGDGTELLRLGGFNWPAAISVNAADGSCWVADEQADLPGPAVVHLAANGTELLRIAGLWGESLSVNQADGSCWASDTLNADVLRLTGDGTELWRGPLASHSVSVDPTDGSCWVVDSSGSQVVRLAEDGTELWRGGSISSEAAVIAANLADGSCWVGDSVEVVHMDADGSELWRGGGFMAPRAISVNPMDGSCWVADTGNGQVVRLVVIGYEGPRFPDVLPYHWAYEEVEACCDADIVRGYPNGLYRPNVAVTRDQMAVYVSRALAQGDENVPEFAGAPTFPDVGTEHWALDHVEYAVSQNVVAGYPDGYYRPQYEVTRDQMAVYIARSLVAPAGEAALADYVAADPRNFPDVASDFWAYTHIEYCVENGVVQGYLDGYYHPEYVVTRDQMAVYIARAFGLLM
jgi:DNA-binding beta-propeller fold protein YncE